MGIKNTLISAQQLPDCKIELQMLSLPLSALLSQAPILTSIHVTLKTVEAVKKVG